MKTNLGQQGKSVFVVATISVLMILLSLNPLIRKSVSARSDQFALSTCGEIYEGHACTCSVTGTNRGVWTIFDYEGHPIIETVIEIIPPTTITFVPYNTGRVAVVAFSFDPFISQGIREYVTVKRNPAMQRSSLSISANPSSAILGDTVTISGFISPPRRGSGSDIVKLIIRQSPEGYGHDISVDADSSGRYNYAFEADAVGEWTVQAFFLGDLDRENSISSRVSFTVRQAPRIACITAGCREVHTINSHLCPGPITESVIAVIKGSSQHGGSPIGLDWARIYWRKDNGPQQYAELLLSGETRADLYYRLGPFEQSGTVSYYFRARDVSGNESRAPTAGYYTLRVDNCPVCTSWSTDFWPPDDGFKFKNYNTNLSLIGHPGVCTGMSTAALDYFDSTRSIPSYYNQWVDPPGTEPNNPLSCYIWERHKAMNSRIVPWIFAQVGNSPIPYVRNRQQYERIKTHIITNHEPALVGLGSGPGGHSVVVYAVTECTDDRVALSVYDPNSVLMLTGAYPSLVEGHFRSDMYGLVIDSTSTGNYDDLFATFAAPLLPLPHEPILDPLCNTSDLRQATTEAANAGYIPGATSIVESQLDQGESETYQFLNDRNRSSAVFVSWSGSSLRLEVYRPNGSRFARIEGYQSPLIVQIPKGETDGAWSYRVTGVSVPYSNYPCLSFVGYKWNPSYLPFVVSGR